jgi:hypothetical protein
VFDATIAFNQIKQRGCFDLRAIRSLRLAGRGSAIGPPLVLPADRERGRHYNQEM